MKTPLLIPIITISVLLVWFCFMLFLPLLVLGLFEDMITDIEHDVSADWIGFIAFVVYYIALAIVVGLIFTFIEKENKIVEKKAI